MRPLSVSYHGILGIWGELKQSGSVLFLKLTKGCGSVWCAAVNAELMSRMNSASRSFFFFHLQPDDNNEIAECKELLVHVLRREVKLFLRNPELNPFGYYPFQRKNFKYYASNGEVNTSTANYLPIRKYQEIMTAFAMGTHHRLGGSNDCFVRLLPNDLVMHIFSW